MQTTAYRWACLLCGASNEASNACTQCTFPAEATGQELDLAKCHGVKAVYRQRKEAETIRAKWVAQPMWQKAGDVVALAILIVSVVLVRLAEPIEYNVLGLLLIALMFLWMCLSRWLTSKRPTNGPALNL